MEGDKICNNCGKKKIEHLYVWGIPNTWVCPISFFVEKPKEIPEMGDLTKDADNGILNL